MIPNNTHIEIKIAEAIKEGELKMRPRWHFLLKAALLVWGFVVTLLVVLYLTSFLFFSRSLPLVLLCVLVGFVVFCEMLLRQYEFGYGKPLAYTLGGVIIVALCVAAFLQGLRAHERLYNFVERRQVPVAEPFYRYFGPPPGHGEVNRVLFVR